MSCPGPEVLEGYVLGSLDGPGAASVEAAVVHALHGDDVARALAEAGISCVISSDSVIHPTNQVRLAPLLAEALRNEPSP